MVIDIILDRRDAILDSGVDDWDYAKAKDLYDSAESSGFTDLCYALDYLEEKDVKRELCNYIDEQEYKPSIKKFVNSVDWLPKDA